MTEVALQAVGTGPPHRGDHYAHPRQRHRSGGEQGRVRRHHRAVGIGQIVAALSAWPARCAERRRGHHLRPADLEAVGIGPGRCPPDQMRLRVPVSFPAAGVHLARQCAAADARRGHHVRSPTCASAAWPCSARSDLPSTRNKRPNQLSGGQRQRVAIARALSNRPEIIVADEPTGALDTASTEQVFSILRDIADQGQTVVVVTHDPALAARADRRIHIVDGKIAEVTAGAGARWFARWRVRSPDFRSRYKISKTTPCKVGWGPVRSPQAACVAVTEATL